MTDLTPEQIEKWAGDEEAALAFKYEIENVLEDLHIGTEIFTFKEIALLHAHATILQQQATIERLTAIIQDWHDYGYERSESEQILKALQEAGE